MNFSVFSPSAVSHGAINLLAINRTNQRPEVIASWVGGGRNNHRYVISNLGEYSACQVELFFHEDHGPRRVTKPASISIPLLSKGQKKSVVVYVDYPFEGCMSNKEVWLEYSGPDGVTYRSVLRENNSGINDFSIKRILKRSSRYKTKVQQRQVRDILSVVFKKIYWRCRRV